MMISTSTDVGFDQKEGGAETKKSLQVFQR